MDQFRAMAYLDLMNEISAEARIAAGPPEEGLGAPGEARVPRRAGAGRPGRARSGAAAAAPTARATSATAGARPPTTRRRWRPTATSTRATAALTSDGPARRRRPARASDLPTAITAAAVVTTAVAATAIVAVVDAAVIPGPAQADRPDHPPGHPPRPARPGPGESHGFGPLDPALCRALAALAAASPHTTACVTVTDHNGYAIGHGCLTTGRGRAQLPGAPAPPLTALPARLNLTITATRLAKLLQPARATAPDPAPHRRPAGPSPRRATPRPARTRRPTRPGAGPGPSPCPAACSTPSRSSPSPPTPATTAGSRTPTRPTTCSATWSRSATASAPCRPAPATRKSPTSSTPSPTTRADERARCNAGARSRACHQVKQSPGWKVTQPKPGWHQWETPCGRTYTQEPKRYPSLTRRRPGAEAAGPRPGRPARTPAGEVPRSARARECRGPRRR